MYRYLEQEDKNDYHRASFEHLPTSLSMKLANNSRNKYAIKNFKTGINKNNRLEPSSMLNNSLN